MTTLEEIKMKHTDEVVNNTDFTFKAFTKGKITNRFFADFNVNVGKKKGSSQMTFLSSFFKNMSNDDKTIKDETDYYASKQYELGYDFKNKCLLLKIIGKREQPLAHDRSTVTISISKKIGKQVIKMFPSVNNQIAYFNLGQITYICGYKTLVFYSNAYQHNYED